VSGNLKARVAKIAVDFTILTEIILEPDVPGVSLFFQILHRVSPPPKKSGRTSRQYIKCEAWVISLYISRVFF